MEQSARRFEGGLSSGFQTETFHSPFTGDSHHAFEHEFCDALAPVFRSSVDRLDLGVAFAEIPECSHRDRNALATRREKGDIIGSECLRSESVNVAWRRMRPGEREVSIDQALTFREFRIISIKVKVEHGLHSALSRFVVER